MPTEKRERQRAARQARLEAEEKRAKRRKTLRRVVVIVIAAAVVVGVSVLLGHHHSTKATAATTTTAAPTFTPTSAGGSGNTDPSAVTTSADCPASLSATLNKPKFPDGPTTAIDPTKTYTATVTTDVGNFTIQLDPKTAPLSVQSFVFLAKNHFYDCVVFHRVIQTFMNQTGDPTGTGSGGPGYQFTEHGPTTASPQYPVGSVAMANSSSGSADPSTNGSQFFIVTGPEGESLPPDYVLFGTVTSGMDVLQKINADGSASTSSQGTPTVEHRMLSVTVTES